MQLFADRFLVDDRNVVTDLASGARITLIVSSAGPDRDQARWALRCQRFSQVRQPAIAPLDDYGVVGGADAPVRRFEAWRCGAPVSGRSSAIARAVRVAKEHLHANGLTVGRITTEAVRAPAERGRAPVVLPDAEAGYETKATGSGAQPVVTDADVLGVRLLPPDTLTAIVDPLADAISLRPRLVGLWGGERAGVGDWLRQIARAARAQGFLPIAAGRFRVGAQALVGRSVLVISRDRESEAWRHLVHWSVQTGRPAILIIASEHEVPSIDTLKVPAYSRDQLIESVQPSTLSSSLRQRVRRAADRSHGLPGRFADLLWTTPSAAGKAGARVVSRAAERAPAYGPTVELSEAGDAGSAMPASSTPETMMALETAVPLRPPPCRPMRGGAARWVSKNELAAWRRRMDQAIGTLARGRHASADRQLRSVIGGLTRREDWFCAARAGLALGHTLLARGRAVEARTILIDAHAAAMRGGEPLLLVDIATAQGTAALDLLQLDAAQTTLYSAVAAAEGLDDRPRMELATLALARCLFWCGRFDEAASVLGHPKMENAAGAAAVHLAAARARVAVGAGDAATARNWVSRAEALSAGTNDHASVATAAYASALARLAVGDFAAVDHDIAACLDASRAARQTLLGVCARLLAAENHRRSGRQASAALTAARIGRIGRAQLPPIVRARLTLLTDLIAAAAPAQVLKRHVDTTGLKALALYGPPPQAPGILPGSVNDIVDILGCCHAAEDDAAVLGKLCGWLRARLGAASVVFFTAAPDAVVTAAVDGGRIDATFGRRLIDAGQQVVPHQAEARIEGGVPVRYGGRIVGALAARWGLGSPVDVGLVDVLLATAATAAAPALAALGNHRVDAAAGLSPELLGVSGQMADVRRAIERAAAAPFATLIEGESGSGKELVARALHRRSPRRDRPFCTLNCAALPDDLVESELFGHARGAFTGAICERPGVFEEAHTGTLFLDEIGELSSRAQAKVLRTIQEGELRRVGENLARRVDVRLVTATNRDLGHEVAAGRFRLDLLYRLDVLRIVVPPLRDRRDDVPVLAEHFWREATRRIGSRAALGTATLAALARYDWPGNVRELQNVLASLAVRSPKRGVVSPAALPALFDGARADDSWRLHEARRTFDARFIRAALARSGGHRSRAADELGLTRQGLAKLMIRLGIVEAP